MKAYMGRIRVNRAHAGEGIPLWVHSRAVALQHVTAISNCTRDAQRSSDELTRINLYATET